MTEKDFKSIDEQIAILRGRGLTIIDEARAKQFLLRNNYYRISSNKINLLSNVQAIGIDDGLF